MIESGIKCPSQDGHSTNSQTITEKPKNYQLMIQIAEKLAQNIPFVRVDLYEINNKLYFGELTFFPGAGLTKFEPDEFDRKFGDLIDLSLVKKEKKKK